MLRIALVGKNKTANVWVGNHMYWIYNLTHKRLSDPLENFVKRSHWWLGPKRGKVYKWEQKLAIYDFLYKMEPDIWVNYLDWRLKKQKKPVVVTDVRYVSELEYLRDKLGFIVIRIFADNKKLTKSLGREYAPGTLLLAESFGKDFTSTVKADYTMTWDWHDRDKGRKQVKIIMDDIYSKNVDN